MQLHWDIFCRVIDNYGDIGVCWRLARQLAVEHGKRVRLWVDDLHSLQVLCPEIDCSASDQFYAEIAIRHWTPDSIIDRAGEVVIEAFACELPDEYLRTMAATQPRPCWINLEYLTAEPWAESCHGMASPHPSLPLVKYFFFPGFSASSGGLLREADLPPIKKQACARDAGFDISLFCYETAPVGELIDILAVSTYPVRLHVAPGKPLLAVSLHLGGAGPWHLGKLSVLPFAFKSQHDFDRLLSACAINFVRGEDSFVRAQWVGRPFVWQIYRQDEEAHLVKLSAFLDLYSAEFGSASEVVKALFLAWNSVGELLPAWQGFVEHIETIEEGNLRWTKKLTKNEDLAAKLVKFCASKV